MMIRIVLIVALFFFSKSAFATVEKNELRESIEMGCREQLIRQLDQISIDSQDLEEARRKIDARCKQWSGTVWLLPSPVVSDELAAWIKKSLISEINGLGLRFLRSSNNNARFIASIREVEELFPTLTNEKAASLIIKRDRLMSETIKFHAEVESLIIRKFSKGKSLEVDKSGVLEPGFPRFVEALQYAQSLDERPIYGQKERTYGVVSGAGNKSGERVRKWDVNAFRVDSRLLNLAFVRDVMRRIDTYARMDWFATYSITSPLYDDSNPLSNTKRISFTELSPQISSYLDKTVIERDSRLEVRLEGLTVYLSDTFLLMPWGQKPKGVDRKSVLKPEFVVFASSPEDWDLLKGRSNALTVN